MSKIQHGGRRANQTGRPRKPDKKIRIGTLFLTPDNVSRLAKRADDSGTLIATARHIIESELQK